MKKLYILLLTALCLVLSCFAYKSFIIKTENQQIINAVSLLEKQDYLFKTLQVSYDDYLKNIKPIILPESNYLDKYYSNDITVFANGSCKSNKVKKQDITSINKDELKQLRDKLVPLDQKPSKIINFSSIEISRVYESKATNEKTVFVTQPRFGGRYYDKDCRKYILKKDKGIWKVAYFYSTIITAYGTPRQLIPSSAHQFEEYNNGKVIYDTIIDIEVLNAY